MATLECKIEVCYYNTRTYFYNCQYKDVIKVFAEHSSDFDDLYQKPELYKFITYQFFKDSSITGYDFIRYKKDKKKDGSKYKDNINECKRNDFSVFRLNLNDSTIKKWFSEENLLNKIKPIYKKLVLLLNIYEESFIKLSGSKIDDFDKTIGLAGLLTNSIEKMDDFEAAFKVLKKRFKIIKFKLNHFYEKNSKKIKEKYISTDNIYSLIEKFYPSDDEKNKIKKYLDHLLSITFDDTKKVCIKEKAFKAEQVYLEAFNRLISDIDDYLDVWNIIKNIEYEIVAFVSKLGTINISFIGEETISRIDKNKIEFVPCDEKNRCPFMSTEYFDKDIKKNAIEISKGICSNIDKLSKMHSVIDTNNFFESNNKMNFLGFYEKNCNSPLNKAIYRSSNTYKASYLKFYYDYINKDNCQREKRQFFNLISLLVGYSRKFDEYSLYEIARSQDGYRHYYKDYVINDLLDQETSHLYYCDGGFTYSIIDPVPNAKELNKNSGENFLLTGVPMHQFSIYSKQDFSKLVAALTFGSASTRIYEFFLKYANMKLRFNSKIITLYKQHSVTALYSYIDLRLNHLLFATKSKEIGLTNSVFDALNSGEYEDRADKALNITWRHSNLVNNQFYSRIGIYMSLASLFISLVSFGWIGFIVPTLEKQPIDVGGLLEKFWTVPKFYAIFIIALIPLALWIFISLVAFFRIRCKKKNLAKTFLNKIMFRKFPKCEKET